MRSERGSITLFTLIAMIFMLTIAFTAYASAIIKLQAQTSELDRIAANYNKELDAESLAMLYENLTEPEKGKASRYTCIDGIWCNSPELIGFNLTCTYYVSYDESGHETISPKSVAEQEAPPNWYSYGEKRWANVVTINNGNKTYWTWIPRYVYKTPTEDSSLPANTTDVKFVGDDGEGNEVCYMNVNGEQATIDVSSYKSVKAFEFNGKQLKGYWTSKYRVQEGDSTRAKNSTSNIEVDVSGFEPSKTKYVTYNDSGQESIGANIQVDSNGVATNTPQNWYDYNNKKWANLVTENNGNKTYWTYIPRYQYQTPWKYLIPELLFMKSTDTAQSGYKMPQAFEFNGQQLKGYWVSKYRVQSDGEQNLTVANIEVDVSGFNPSTTKYVTYNDSGQETIGSNITIKADGTADKTPQNWYDYSKKKWANLVTENNGLKSYWTYIPRYQYKMSDWTYYTDPKVQFLKTTDSLLSGFKLPQAFVFNNKQLRGYWMSKYRVQDNTNNTEFKGTYYQKSN